MHSAQVPTARPKSQTVAQKPRFAEKRATSFEPEVAAAFGTTIRAERVRLEIPQDAFALLANVDRSYYGKLERGERQPSLALMLRISGGLGLSGAELMAKVEQAMRLRARRSKAAKEGNGSAA